MKNPNFTARRGTQYSDGFSFIFQTRENLNNSIVNKNLLRGLLLTTGLLLALPLLQAQISSPTADFADSVAYLSTDEKDPLFVFHQRHGGYRPGSLTAVHPSGGNRDFSWSAWNTAAGSFDPPFRTETGVPSSSVNQLAEGGYRVAISGGADPDLELMAWVMLDKLEVWIEKDDEDRLPPTYYTCDWLVLMGHADPDTLVYWDKNTAEEIRMLRDFRFRWTSDNDDLNIPNDSTILAPNRTYSPPYKDTWYILTVTDDLGMTEVDSVFYESIQTRAEFSVEYLDKITGEWDPELTTEFDNEREKGSLDAPLTVRFINESLNGERFVWTFVDTTGAPKDTAVTYNVDEKPEFTYYNADEYYYPSLLSVSLEKCEDSTKLEGGIQVVGSQLEIPNVFTPNNDGVHDLWVFKHQSIKKCRITIVDRSGKVVYKQKIEDIYQWEGWNGKMHESDRDAPAGQYYFVIEALGYDGVEYRDETIWEQMKIFGGPGRNTGNTGTTGGTGGTGTENENQIETVYTGWLYLYRTYTY